MMDYLKRKIYGAYETPIDIFWKHIYPEIKDILWEYIWVDLFCGSGNLILPILEDIEKDERVSFFEDHIYCFDILPEMVKMAIKRAVDYGIPKDIAMAHIRIRDTMKYYPKELLNLSYPIYHITNPPYLYIGYIRKHKETQFWLDYFNAEKKGLQDLYQIALINDMLHDIPKMIYIIPTNFLFGYSVSNKARLILLEKYYINKVIIFEKKIFEYTGQHVGIFFFERKRKTKHEPQKFVMIKINSINTFGEQRNITILPENYYRAGTEFEFFVSEFKSEKPLKVKYYLFLDDIIKNPGNYRIIGIDSNSYKSGKGYTIREFYVSKELYEKIKNNDLFVKTIDGVSPRDKASIYFVHEVFGVDCIVVTRSPYRTHPIQIFLEPTLKYEDRLLLKEYFNKLLNYFREITDSEFMTTYKYVNKQITRKYLGLTQVRKLIETFPILELDEHEKEKFRQLVFNGMPQEIIKFIKKFRSKKRITLDAWV